MKDEQRYIIVGVLDALKSVVYGALVVAFVVVGVIALIAGLLYSELARWGAGVAFVVLAAYVTGEKIRGRL